MSAAASMPGPCPTCGATRPCDCKRSDAERDVKACGQRDDGVPFAGWGQRRTNKTSKASMAPTRDGQDEAIHSRRAETSESAPFLPEDMQAVAVALFGECRVPSCCALLEVDGSCPFASEHPKHECKACGALHDEPLDHNHPCLFCRAAAE